MQLPLFLCSLKFLFTTSNRFPIPHSKINVSHTQFLNSRTFPFLILYFISFLVLKLMIQFYFITFLFISFHKFLIGAKSVRIQFITNNNNNNKNSNLFFRFVFVCLWTICIYLFILNNSNKIFRFFTENY